MSFEGENAYKVLGVTPDTPDAHIRKAYRKLALQKHPDKNPDNPNAAAEFAAIQRAYDIITDSEARQALDTWLQAQQLRQERDDQRSEKRRKMMQDLQQKESFHSSRKNEEQLAKERLEKEIERLRKRATDRRQAAYADLQKEDDATIDTTKTTTTGVPTTHQQEDLVHAQNQQQQKQQQQAELDIQLQRTLKVTWSRPVEVYDGTRIKSIFSALGPVEDVIMRDKKKKGSALVVMVHEADAVKALNSVHGDMTHPLLVTLVGSSTGGTAGGIGRGATPPLVNTRGTAAGTTDGIGNGSNGAAGVVHDISVGIGGGGEKAMAAAGASNVAGGSGSGFNSLKSAFIPVHEMKASKGLGPKPKKPLFAAAAARTAAAIPPSVVEEDDDI